MNKFLLAVCSLTLCFLALNGTALASHELTKHTALVFTQNAGQVVDTDGKPRADVLFTAKHNGVHIFFRTSGVSYVYTKEGMQGDQPTITSLYRTDVTFVGARRAEVEASEACAFASNYYLPHAPQGVTGVTSFKRLAYKNIYPNIDLVFYAGEAGTNLKYEFIVHPGGNPDNIALQYLGFDQVNRTIGGELKTQTPLGSYAEDKPYTFSQNGATTTDVVSAFHVSENNILKFKVGAYDATKTLVIDPMTRLWATNFGGSTFDRAYGVSLSPSGAVNICGPTTSINFPVTVGALDVSANGQQDAFIAQFNTDGTLRWATYYGGSSSDQAQSVAVATNGNINVAGHTTSSNISVPGAFQATAGGQGDGFILQLADAGTLNWATYYGGTSNDQLLGVAVDVTNNNIAVAGRTFSTGMGTAGTAQPNLSGSRDALLAVFNNAGARQWATYLGGAGDDMGFGVAYDAGAGLYLCGQTNSTSGIASVGAAQITLGGLNDALVAGYNRATGAKLWSTYFGGSGNETANNLIVASTNIVYVAGLTASSNFPVRNASQATLGGLTDGFAMGLDGVTGGLSMATYIGGNGTDQAFDLGEIGGAIYVCGGTNSQNFPNICPPGAVNLPCQAVLGGSFDVFFQKIDGAVVQPPVWSIVYGGSRDELATCMDVNAAGDIVLAGYTNGPDFPTLNPVVGQPVAGSGNDDAFILMLHVDVSNVCTLTGAVVSTTNTDPQCHGDATGKIVVTSPTGATLRYSLNGGPQQASPTFDLIPAGVYAVTITNTSVANCSVTSANITLNDPTIIALSAVGDVITCPVTVGCITVTALGGVPPYQYSIDGGVNFQPGNAFCGIPADNGKTILVEDANGCSSAVTANVSQSVQYEVVAASVSLVKCGLDNGSVLVTDVLLSGVSVPGPFQYRLEGPSPRGLQASPSFINLKAGKNYKVYIQDANGCIAHTDSIIVGEAPFDIKIVSAVPSAVGCNGGTGSLIVTISGTPPSYTYQLTTANGVQSQTINTLATVFPNVPAGPFTLTVMDGNGCFATPLNGNIPQPTPISVGTAVQQYNCATGQLAQITVNASGGTGLLRFSVVIQGNAHVYGFNNVFTGLAAGTYEISVQDASNCTSTPVNAVINPSNDVTILNVTLTEPTCPGEANGEIEVDVLGGLSPYTYMIVGRDTIANSGNQTEAFTGFAKGNYVVKVVDNNGCMDMRNVTLTDPPTLKITGIQGTPPSFCGNIDGLIDVTASGGTGNLVYSFDDGLTFSASNIYFPAPGSFYLIKVRDQDGLGDFCQVDTSFALNDAGAPNIINVQVVPPICSNDPNLGCTGQIVASAFGSQPKLYFLLFNRTNGLLRSVDSSLTGTHTFLNICPGEKLSLIVSTDLPPSGCNAYWKPIDVPIPAPIIISNVQLTPPQCGNPAVGGTMTITATGGAGGFAYSADNGKTFSSSKTITGLFPRAGGYTVNVRDQFGCTAVGGTYFFFNPSGLTLPAPTVVRPGCGQTNGKITVAPTGGTLPRFFSINGGAEVSSNGSAFVYNNLPEGTYELRVRDNNGCIAVATVDLSNLAIVNLDLTPPTCGQNDGQLTFLLSGGSGSYTYRLTGQRIDATIIGAANQPMTINTPQVFPGTGNDVLSGLMPGVYYIEIIDANAQAGTCILRDTVVLMPNGGPQILNVVKLNRNCNLATGAGSQGSIAIYASGSVAGYMIAGPYSENMASGAASGTFTGGANFLPAGTYHTYAYNVAGCASYGGAVTITQPSPIIITDVPVTQPQCGGGVTTGSFSMQVIGGTSLQYSLDGTVWQSGSSFSGLDPGPTVYQPFVRQTGLASCAVQWAFPIQITTQSGLLITVTGTTPATCSDRANGTISINIVGGSRPYDVYLDDDFVTTRNTSGAYTLTSVLPGSRKILVRDANSCEFTVYQDVLSPAPLDIDMNQIVFTRPDACFTGGGITVPAVALSGGTGPYLVAVDGGVNFQPPGTAFTNMVSGAYKIVVRDANGCEFFDYFFLSSNTIASVSINGILSTDVTCFGQNDGTISINAGRAGDDLWYTVDGSDPNPTSVTAQHLNGDFFALAPGIYDIRVGNQTPGRVCESPAGLFRVIIAQPSNLIISTVLVTQPNCTTRPTGKIVINALGGSGSLEYSVNNGINFQDANTFTGLTVTNPFFPYIVVVRDKISGCSVTWPNPIEIINPSQLYLIFDQAVDIINTTCPGATDGGIRVNISVNQFSTPTPFPINVYLNGVLDRVVPNSASPNMSYIITNLAPGPYTIRIVDKNGCYDEESGIVGEPTPLSLTTVLRQPSSCGATDGRISVTLSGGYDIPGQRQIELKRDGVTVLTRNINVAGIYTGNFNNLGAGSYQVIARNRFTTCELEKIAILRDPTTPDITGVTTTPAANQVCSNGSVRINIFGGGVNIQYELNYNGLWLGVQAMPNFINTPAGTYFARVRTGLLPPYCFNTYGPFTVGCTAIPPRFESMEARQAAFEVYPNPNKGRFTVSLDAPADGAAELRVISLTGQTLFSHTYDAIVGKNEIPVELYGYAAGLYLVEMRYQGAMTTRKVVLQ